jgi:hypothetical protein
LNLCQLVWALETKALWGIRMRKELAAAKEGDQHLMEIRMSTEVAYNNQR